MPAAARLCVTVVAGEGPAKAHAKKKAVEGAKAADRALEKSRESRVRAQAEGLKAVAALRAGDRASALSLFKAAAALDPAEALFPMSAGELESGKYAVERAQLA